MAGDYPFYTNPTNTTYNPQKKAVTGPVGQGGTAGGAQNADYPFYTYGQQNTQAFRPTVPTTPPPGGAPPPPPAYPIGGGGGGGGGGGSTPIDYSGWGGWAAQTQPGMISYSPLDQQYLEWDPSMFDQARAGVATGIADARKRGGTAFDLAAQQYANYRDPYAAGPKATNPGVDPALIRSMQAWGGAGSGAAMAQNNYANTADAAMGNIYDLLGSVGERYNTDLRNAVQGDRMQFDQGMDMANNELNLATDMAKARAFADWRQRDMDARNQTAMMNWARRNQVNDQNTSTTNQWNSGVLDAILQMIGSGGTGIPVANNDLSRLITMNPYQAV